MKIYVERHIFVNVSMLDELCFKSKNLYNKANYVIRQKFIETSKQAKDGELERAEWIRYIQIDKIAKQEDWPEYKELPAQTSQQILRLLDKNWLSFFKAINIWKKDKTKFSGRPKLPKYKKKDGKNIVIFTGQQVRLRDGFIHFPQKANLSSLKTKIDKIQQVRIIPQATCYVIEVVYKVNPEQIDVDKNNILTIDLGLDNLATCVSNVEKSFIINGKPLKSMNQYFNKLKALFQSYVDSNGTSNRIRKLTHKRNMKVQNYLHQISAFIRKYCIEYKIGTVIIGKNIGWKQDINLGKKTNQNFVNIPFDTLIKQLQYKLSDIGIDVILVEESYTSKIDHLAYESLEKHEHYLGKRIKRGLFQSSIGKLINADVNGCIGIGRKVIGDSFIEMIANRGHAYCPVRFNVA